MLPLLPPPAKNRPEHPFVGQVRIHGLLVNVENEHGSFREGVDPFGAPWRVRMVAGHYGEIARTEGADGDPVDVYVGPDATAPLVFVVRQVDPDTNAADEVKVMLGYATLTDAQGAYRAQYDRPGFYGGCWPMPVAEFKAWLRSGAPWPATPLLKSVTNVRVRAHVRHEAQKGLTMVRAFTRKAPEGHRRLFRGDSNPVEVYRSDKTDADSLFGRGLYLTSSSTVAGDYGRKGSTEKPSWTHTIMSDGGPQTREQAFEAWEDDQFKAATGTKLQEWGWYDRVQTAQVRASLEAGKPARYHGDEVIEAEWLIERDPTKRDAILANVPWAAERLEKRARERAAFETWRSKWAAETGGRDAVVLRKVKTGWWNQWEIRPAGKAGIVSGFDVPERVLHATLDADKPLDDKAVDAIAAGIDAAESVPFRTWNPEKGEHQVVEPDPDTKGIASGVFRQLVLTHAGEIDPQTGQPVGGAQGQRPTLRDVWGQVARAVKHRVPERWRAFERVMRQHGYSGFRYDGGITIGGRGKHDAYALWDVGHGSRWRVGQRLVKGSGIDPEQLAIGTREEFEHTNDPDTAQKIAEDHLREDPDYYRKLRAIGLIKGIRVRGHLRKLAARIAVVHPYEREGDRTTPAAGTRRLYRGDSRRVDYVERDRIDAGSLFGPGLYLTTSPTVAKSYTAKGGSSDDTEGHWHATEEDALRARAKKNARRLIPDEWSAPRLYAHEKRIEAKYAGDPRMEPQYGLPVSSFKAQQMKVVPEIENELNKKAELEYQRMRAAGATAEKLPGHSGWQIKDPRDVGHVSVFDVPERVLLKTIDARLSMPKTVRDDLNAAAVIGWTAAYEERNPTGLIKPLPHDEALARAKDRVEKRAAAAAHAAETGATDGHSFERYFELVLADLVGAPGGSGERPGWRAFRQEMQRRGYSGVTYEGGTHIGGYGEHTAYVLWDLDAAMTKWRREVVRHGASDLNKGTRFLLRALIKGHQLGLFSTTVRTHVAANPGGTGVHIVTEHQRKVEPAAPPPEQPPPPPAVTPDPTPETPVGDPVCPHCGEPFDGAATHYGMDMRVGDGKAFGVFLACCEGMRDDVEAVGYERAYGRTLKEVFEEFTGQEVLDIIEGGDGTVVGRLRIVDPTEAGKADELGRKAAASPSGWRDEVFGAVEKHHRHHKAPQGWKFGVAVYNGLARVGVATVGRPVSRALQEKEPHTLEVTRVTTFGEAPLRQNATSKLYAAAAKRARSLGYTKLITYTLADVESGASLVASGWTPTHVSDGGSWSSASRERSGTAPEGKKIRWERGLTDETRRDVEARKIRLDSDAPRAYPPDTGGAMEAAATARKSIKAVKGDRVNIPNDENVWLVTDVRHDGTYYLRSEKKIDRRFGSPRSKLIKFLGEVFEAPAKEKTGAQKLAEAATATLDASGVAHVRSIDGMRLTCGACGNAQQIKGDGLVKHGYRQAKGRGEHLPGRCWGVGYKPLEVSRETLDMKVDAMTSSVERTEAELARVSVAGGPEWLPINLFVVRDGRLGEETLPMERADFLAAENHSARQTVKTRVGEVTVQQFPRTYGAPDQWAAQAEKYAKQTARRLEQKRRDLTTLQKQQAEWRPTIIIDGDAS